LYLIFMSSSSFLMFLDKGAPLYGSNLWIRKMLPRTTSEGIKLPGSASQLGHVVFSFWDILLS
jgi:hypothetical protein